MTGASPKSAVFLHVNDTFGTAMAKGIGAVSRQVRPALQDRRRDRLRPGHEGSLGRGREGEGGQCRPAALVVSRLNDAILMTRELVKQRWTPQAILSMGPGWYEDQYLKTLGKLSDGPISFVPWYDPNKKLSPVLEAALAKAYPDVNHEHQPHLHLRGAARRRRRLQARRLGRRGGADRSHPRHQHHRQCQHRPAASCSTRRARTPA